MKFCKKYLPASLADVEKLERFAGGKLPVDYKVFLTADGGGVLDGEFFRIGDEVSELFVLFSFDSVENSILEETEILSERGVKGGVAIGRDSGGERLFLNLCSGDFCGGVFLTDGYNEHDVDLNWGLIAESFSEFTKSLFVQPAKSPPDDLRELARNGSVRDMILYLEKGGSVDALANRGVSLMQAAAAAGNIEIVRLLLRSNANPFCALHYALINSEWDCAKLLVESGVDVNEVNENGERPYELIFGIYGEKKKELIRFLVSHGAIVP